MRLPGRAPDRTSPLVAGSTQLEDLGDKSRRATSPRHVELFGKVLPVESGTAQFLILCGGIFFMYLFFGYFQESVTTATKFHPTRKLGWTITLTQFTVTFLGSFALNPPKITPTKRQWIIFAAIAICSAGSMGCSNASCEYLNYPTQVCFKCGKVIMVMAVGVIFFQKKYVLLDYLCVFLVSIGLFIFLAGDALSQAKLNNTFGMTLMLGSLTCDAFIGNLQEKAMKKYKSTPASVLCYSKGIGIWFLLATCAAKGEFRSLFEYIDEGEYRLLLNILGVAFCSFIGENIIMAMIKRFDPVLTVMVTNIRKALTISLSFLFFPKHFSYHYPLGGAVLFLGIMTGVYRKNREKADRACWDLLRWLRIGRKKLRTKTVI